MAKSPWFKAYADDWLTSPRIRQLSMTERGYMNELMHISWHQTPKGTLPLNLREISGYFPGKFRDFSRIFAGKLGGLWQEKDGRYVNDKMFKLGQEFEKAKENKSKAGRAGAEIRWQNHHPANGNKEADTETDVEEPRSKSLVHSGNAPPPAEKSNPKPKYPPEFEAFWKAYPLKKGKGTAVKAWARAVKGGVANETLIGAVGAALEKDQQWIRDGGNYIPHPSTWLNSSGWEDEHESEVSRQPRWVQRLEAGEFDSSRRNGRHHADA